MGFIISLQREIFSYCKNSTVCVDGHFSRSKVDVSAEQVTTKMNIKMQWNLIKDLALETLKYLHTCCSSDQGFPMNGSCLHLFRGSASQVHAENSTTDMKDNSFFF